MGGELPDGEPCVDGGLGASLRVEAGPLRVESALLREVAGWQRAVRRDPSLLARPLRVVVPSDSLRDHVLARVASACGCVAGLEVETLSRLAREVLSRAGATPLGEAFVPLLVREAAREEPALREELDALGEAWGVVEAAVSDLLDAGFEPALCDAVEERLEAAAGDDRERERALALVRAAARACGRLEELGLWHRSTVLRRARQELEADPSLLPAGRTLVHGFADATGLATDLVAALVTRCGAVVLLDAPPEPGEPERACSGMAFARRFRERLEGLAPLVAARAGVAPPPSLEAIEAQGAAGEVRAVAERIAALLERGERPEGIAIVARDLRPYASALRVHLRRLAVPFSGGATPAPPGGRGRQLAALLELLRARERCRAERWLALVSGRGLGGRPLRSTGSSPADAEAREELLRAALRRALHACGAARIAEVASLASPASPASPEAGRCGAGASPKGGRCGPGASPDRLARVVARARATCDRLAAWPERGRLDEHARALRALAATLGWRAGHPLGEHVEDALDRLAGALPEPASKALELDREDFVQLLGGSVEDAIAERLGGRGGGVQLLSVMEARARTFAHVFALGLNRDVFPRPIHEDPLLPDRLRRPLTDLLPELPLKQRGHEEERFLFAQLLAASPRVTLSWQCAGHDGRARAPSTLVERLRWAVPALRVERCGSVREAARPHGPVGSVGPVWERALRAALHGSRADFEMLLPAAMHERVLGLGRVGAEELAESRLAVLRELDAAPGARRSLGPYFGLVGPVRVPAGGQRGETVERPSHPGSEAESEIGPEVDRRAGPVAVTVLERLARCPWQVHVERLLRVEPVPDPLAAPADVDAALVGSLVHAVLQRIVEEAAGAGTPRTLEEVRGARPVAVRWPEAGRVEELVAQEAERLLREEGLGFAELAPLLVLRARPFLERARELDWPDAASVRLVLGAEMEGELVVPGLSPDAVIRFRADRVDCESEQSNGANGALCLTDYKTGRPLSSAARPETRRRHLLQAVARGAQLQAAAYALAGRSGSDRGRYLHLAPEVDPTLSAVTVDGSDEEVARCLAHASRVLLRAWRLGSLFPRLLEPGGGREPVACSRCRVAEACRRGDSGARARLERWLGEQSANAAPAESALRELWDLPLASAEVAEKEPGQ